jgi:hypothetical protein
MAVYSAFIPKANGGTSVSPASSSDSVTIGQGSKAIRFVNTGENLCYVRVGPAGITASSADTPVLPLSSLIVGKGQDDDTVAYISADGTELHIQPGEGGSE